MNESLRRRPLEEAMGPDALQRLADGIRLLSEALERELPAAVELRRDLHRTACVSGEETESAELIAELMGVELKPVARTGGAARIGPDRGPAVAVRAELDALPMSELTGVSWASTGGRMHACGHDVHQAALVALVRAARRVERDLPVAMVPLLQPREEAYPSGAQDIVESGLLEELGVAAVVAAHVHPRVPLGEVAVGYGPVNAAADTIELRFCGGGGHGAYPHEASSPVLAIAHAVVELEGLVRRVVSPMHPAVLSVGRISSGDAANVVPSNGMLSATLRTMHREDRERMIEAIGAVGARCAEAFGLSCEVSISAGEPVLENSPELVAEFNRIALSEGRALTEPLRSCGSDDFSFYSANFRSIMSFVGVETAGPGPQPTLHHAGFLPTDRAVADVARAILREFHAAALVLLSEMEDADTPAPGQEVANA